MRQRLLVPAVLAAVAIGIPSAAAAEPAVQVVAGGYHTCAILVNGKVKCWGYNGYGQLGLNNTIDRGSAPGQMGAALPSPFFPVKSHTVQLALGFYHTCALDNGGDVYCWGFNSYGQLGYGNTNHLGDNAGEINGGLFSSISHVRKITAGFFHTCALKVNGEVKCWGLNSSGQLGLGDTVNRGDNPGDTGHTVASVPLGGKAIDVAAYGYSTCALLDTHQLKCWGDNSFGQLGLGDTATRGNVPGPLPVVSTGMTPHKIGAGSYHACVDDSDSHAKCWGYNAYGQLGLGDTANRGDGPGEMGAALPFHSFGTWDIAGGAFHTCSHRQSGFVAIGSVKCWGYNGYGALGQGDTVNRGDNPGETVASIPAIDLGTTGTGLPPNVMQITGGAYHTCALISGGIKCWGYNGIGQLGLGDTANRGDNPGEMGDMLPFVDL
jgi:alpha-tubulin suppressor-like RCC1 family protein